MVFVCQVCEREYKRNIAIVLKDQVSGKEYMKCPNDGGIAYIKAEKPKVKATKKAPAKGK